MGVRARARRRATSSRFQERYGLFIGGELVEPRSGEWFTTISPADEEPLAEVAQAGAEDVDLAVQAARGAFEDGWSALRPAERAKYLFRIARILQERARELAVAESLDGGKPIKESRDVDLPLAAAHFFYYAGWADKLEYAFPNRRPRPLGVAGQIIPWNFPLLMLAWKIAPALACGNTVVLKPAETTPLHGAPVRRRLPPGRAAGRAWSTSSPATARPARSSCAHPGIDKVAFTGSTEVGKAIQRELAGRGMPLTLELGGKAANIVFDDCALDQAVEGIVNGIYFNQGHVCCAGSRLLVQESIAEPLVAKLKRRLRDAARRRPARQEHRRRRDQLARPARPDPGAGRKRRARRAPRSTSRRATCPSAATGSRRRSSRTSPSATGSPRRRSSARCSRC